MAEPIPSFGTEPVSDLATAESMMYRDKPLTPKMISTLMNVSNVPYVSQAHIAVEEESGSSFLYTFALLFVSLIIAALVGTAFLYTHDIGPFYDAADAVSAF